MGAKTNRSPVPVHKYCIDGHGNWGPEVVNTNETLISDGLWAQVGLLHCHWITMTPKNGLKWQKRPPLVLLLIHLHLHRQVPSILRNYPLVLWLLLRSQYNRNFLRLDPKWPSYWSEGIRRTNRQIDCKLIHKIIEPTSFDYSQLVIILLWHTSAPPTQSTYPTDHITHSLCAPSVSTSHDDSSSSTRVLHPHWEENGLIGGQNKRRN